MLVPGNNETEEALREACEGWDAATVLHGQGTEIDGTQFFGLGAGVPITPWDWSFDLDEEQAAERLADCPEGAVLVVHSPPKGHCDQSAAGDHLGSEAILGAIEEKRPKLAVCGHIHESWGARSEVGPTVVNLGPEGSCSRSSRGRRTWVNRVAPMTNWEDPRAAATSGASRSPLDEEQQGDSLSERLHNLQLDDEARKRLGGSVIVTRDGRILFIYAWHEESAREAERVIRELMVKDKLVGEVRLMRWHPIAEEWKDADGAAP